jgi:hypothetical protein
LADRQSPDHASVHYGTALLDAGMPANSAGFLQLNAAAA